jgi:heme/copper-type cytochrome/quinol oxidase subunit 2
MSSAVNPDSGSADRGRNRNPGTGTGPGHQELVARQKEQFGGMKFGCSFFGWLTATGTAVLLSALLAAVGTALGLNGIFGAQPAANSQDIRTLGLVSGIVLLVVVLIAYFAGGYVAARMARFSGAKQGLGVWLWALIFTIVVVVIGLIAGNSLDLLSRANGLPQLPVNQGTLTGGGIITLVAIILISLVGAVLGGLAGMRYHRRVDRAGFEAL